MVKRIAALAGAGALIASAVIPVLAHGGKGGPGGSGGDMNMAVVTNGATAMSSTGYVGLSGNGALVMGEDDVTVSGNNTVRTGDAGAYAGAVVVANVETGCCEEDAGPGPCGGCGGRDRGRGGDEDSTMNSAMVFNSATAMSSTGYVGLSGNGALVLGGDDEGAGATCHRGRRCHGGGGDDEDGGVVVTGNNLVDTGDAWSESHAWVLTNLRLMD